jgi:hypothetical protein
VTVLCWPQGAWRDGRDDAGRAAHAMIGAGDEARPPPSSTQATRSHMPTDRRRDRARGLGSRRDGNAALAVHGLAWFGAARSSASPASGNGQRELVRRSSASGRVA